MKHLKMKMMKKDEDENDGQLMKTINNMIYKNHENTKHGWHSRQGGERGGVWRSPFSTKRGGGRDDDTGRHGWPKGGGGSRGHSNPNLQTKCNPPLLIINYYYYYYYADDNIRKVQKARNHGARNRRSHVAKKPQIQKAKPRSQKAKNQAANRKNAEVK